MQVFIIGSVFETARLLDRRRLNKQIIECKQIFKAMDGGKAWANHPCTLQYKEYRNWLKLYMCSLECFIKGDYNSAATWSGLAQDITPDWHTEEYYTNMKKRLYTKDNVHYKQWEYLGESYINMYYVNNEWKYYKQLK